MALIDDIPRVRNALELARMGEAERITEAVQIHRVIGVLGEAEVGKTETIHQAIGHSAPGVAVVRLDLDGAASDEHASFLLAKQIARAQLGTAGFSSLTGGVLLSSETEAGRVELAELLGVDGLDEAMRKWPSGRYPLAKSLNALEELANRRTVILWVDHLEAPFLTARHPFQLDGLLWAIREVIQRVSDLIVVLSGRAAVEDQILDSGAAFHQQGKWLSIDNPSSEAWRKVADMLKIPEPIASELANLTDGHPATMLLALLQLADGGSVRHAHEVLRQLAACDPGLTGRAMQHARSLHRLGGQVMIQIAYGQGPYAAAQRGKSAPQEIRKVLGRLRLAGLLRHGVGWSVVNPLVAIGIRGEVQRLSAPELSRPTCG